MGVVTYILKDQSSPFTPNQHPRPDACHPNKTVHKVKRHTVAWHRLIDVGSVGRDPCRMSNDPPRFITRRRTRDGMADHLQPKTPKAPQLASHGAPGSVATNGGDPLVERKVFSNDFSGGYSLSGTRSSPATTGRGDRFFAHLPGRDRPPISEIRDALVWR